MGSLMAGWSSPTKDIRSEKLERNRSLTKEEIETYWKSKRTEEDHLSPISDHVLDDCKENLLGSVGAADGLKKSLSFPLGGRNNNSVVCSDAVTRSNCWWTRSNWAFLNEPPVKAMEGPSYKYAAQYHVADIGRAKTVNNPEMMSC